jgi:hypothetical protein
MSTIASPRWIVSPGFDLLCFFGGAALSVLFLGLYFALGVSIVALWCGSTGASWRSSVVSRLKTWVIRERRWAGCEPTRRRRCWDIVEERRRRRRPAAAAKNLCF